MSLADNAARMIAERGETMTLSRDGEETTITLKGKRVILHADVVDTGGTSVQQEFRLRVATTELLASAWSTKAPRRSDTITIGGRARSILDVRPISDGDTVAMYELVAAG
jgi:hypothetical protein